MGFALSYRGVSPGGAALDCISRLSVAVALTASASRLAGVLPRSGGDDRLPARFLTERSSRTFPEHRVEDTVGYGLTLVSAAKAALWSPQRRRSRCSAACAPGRGLGAAPRPPARRRPVAAGRAPGRARASSPPKRRSSSPGSSQDRPKTLGGAALGDLNDRLSADRRQYRAALDAFWAAPAAVTAKEVREASVKAKPALLLATSANEWACRRALAETRTHSTGYTASGYACMIRASLPRTNRAADWKPWQLDAPSSA
jgi:hypothetical protein